MPITCKIASSLLLLAMTDGAFEASYNAVLPRTGHRLLGEFAFLEHHENDIVLFTRVSHRAYRYGSLVIDGTVYQLSQQNLRSAFARPCLLA